MSSSAERMSRVDTAWLRMDTEANLMMIVGIWFIRPSITVAQLCERVQAQLLPYKRFRQRVVEDTLGARWVDDEAFDLRHHVKPMRLSRRRGQGWEAALQARVGQLAATPLHPHRPLWEFQLVEDMDGQSALVARIHHCIADGIALIRVMLSLTDGASAPSEAAQQSDDENELLAGTMLGPLVQQLAQWGGKAKGLAEAGVQQSADWVAHPQHALDDSLQVARIGAQAISDVAAFALMADDSATRFKGQARGDKRVAWAEPLPLDAVKAVGKGLGCSVNDVLLSCVAGALGRYLRAKGDEVAGQEIRAMVPVNLRSEAQAAQLGNRFGLVPLVLPIGIANPVERLYAVRARMQALKGSFQPIMAFGLLSVAGLLIKPVQHAMLNIFANKATAVMTNVPGPAEALKFCGATVERIMFWVPQSGDIGMGVSILSYAGQVQFGLITDTALCPDPQAVIDHFLPEFNKLLVLALMLPWEGELEEAGVGA